MHAGFPAVCLGAFALFIPVRAPAENGARVPDPAERVAIGETIRSQLEPLQECYNQRLERVPALRGKLLVRFEIDRDGKVARPSADGMTDAKLVQCVLDEVVKWQFVKPPGNAILQVAYPIVFTAGSASG